MKVFVLCAVFSATFLFTAVNEANAFRIEIDYQGFQPSTHSMGQGQGIQDVYAVRLYSDVGNIIWWGPVYVNNIVQSNGNGGWEEAQIEKNDIRWHEITAELLPLPDSSNQTGVLLKLPVYSANNFVGHIVNTEFYNMYPKSIAYISMVESSLAPLLLQINNTDNK